jgi:hypothetical protein
MNNQGYYANSGKDVLEKGQQLLYPELPAVADDKDHWVPLEMLVVQHAQALRSKRFRPQAKEAAHSVLSSEHKAKIREAGQVFLDRINVLAWAQKVKYMSRLLRY